MRFALSVVVAVITPSCSFSGSSQPTTLTPTWLDASKVSERPIWDSEVQFAIDQWQTAIGDDCELPFVVGQGGQIVRLVSESKWRYSKAPWKVSNYSAYEIEIRDTTGHPRGHWPSVMHEIGHAMGLRDNVHDVWSVTYPSVGTKDPTADDVYRARVALDCQITL